MKKVIYVPLVSLFAALVFVSCMKDDGPNCTSYTTAQDQHVIDSFLDVNNFNSISYSTSDGLYKGVVLPGSGSMPAADSIISFDVVSRLLNGTVLDSTRYPISTSATINYNDLNTSGDLYYSPFIYSAFSGLRKGGLYRTILLSGTQLRCTGATLSNGKVVPPNSQIITDYRLVDVKPAQ